MKITVIVEHGQDNWGAYAPDLPGCAVVAATEAEPNELIQEAITLYIADLRDKGLPMPALASAAREIEIIVV
jgi:predicted RNase H-like HicB family nuclease